MGCERCTKTPELHNQFKKIFVTAGTSELIMKIDEALDAKEFQRKEIQNGLEIQGSSFEGVIRTLGKSRNFVDLAKKDIKVFPVNDQTSLIDQLYQMKTLKEWESLYKATEVIEVLNENRLKTHFQPIFDPHSNEVHGYEALIRGYDKSQQLISPGKMFSMAKDSDLLFNLDRQARETNIRNGSKENIQENLFINFTPTAIYDPEFCLRSTLGVMKEVGMPPEQIVFEVVETEEIKDTEHLKKILDFYKKQGFKIALDDIGSGYSSLNTLAKIFPDYIKIDLEIIRNIDQSPMKQSILHSLITIAKDHDIQVIGEGVETREEFKYLVTAGVDYIQGYYIGKPQEKPEMKFVKD